MLGRTMMEYYVEVAPGTWYHTPLCYGKYGKADNCFLCIVKGPCQQGKAPAPKDEALKRRTDAAK